MERDKIIKELTAGICEITFMDSFSVEHKISATLSTIHLDLDDVCNADNLGHLITMWNVAEEKWQDVPISEIIDVERLTGKGVKGEDDRISPLDIFNEL